MPDFPANPLEKVGYRLDFHDAFDTGQLDTKKWLPYYLPHWSSREQSAANFEFKDNCLVLYITRDQQPCCPAVDTVRASAIQTGTFSGAPGSSIGQHHFRDGLVVREVQQNTRLYTPQYGYFEVRCKGVHTSSNLASLWMIGYEEQPEQSGELTMFEIFGVERGATQSKVRYGVKPITDPKLTNDDFYIETFDIDTTEFHIYALEWTPTHVDYYLDNRKLRRVHQSPDYPMQFMLGVFELPFDDDNAGHYDPNAPYPKTFTVDYVRGYQPEAGYTT